MNELVVFGAGASKALAELPLGNELIWDYYSDNTLLKNEQNGKPDLSKDNKSFSDYKKFLIKAGYYFPPIGYLVKEFEERGESLFNLPDMGKDYYVDEILKTFLEKNDQEAVELARKLIFKHLTSKIFEIRKSEKPLADFLLPIIKNNSRGEISIISFNFDCVLHENFKDDIYFDYMIDFDWIYEGRQNIYKRYNPIPLIKLNGSLDWGICQKCEKLHLNKYSVQDDFYSKESCKFNCDGKIDPFIVMPHQNYNDKISLLWKQAIDFINRADKITIIGYSFPEYDTEVIQLFRKSIKNTANIIVVDHRDSEADKLKDGIYIKAKYNRMFPNLDQEVKVHMDGFEAFVNNY